MPTLPARITSVSLTQIERLPSVSPDGSRLLYSSSFRAVRYWQEARGYTTLADDHLPLEAQEAESKLGNEPKAIP